jgi:beta-N-acetylhexosaminidase
MQHLMIDIKGTSLTQEDQELLRHPKVGGIILFTRNFSSLEQLIELTNAIHQLRDPPLLIAVDHEGGRVQRFRDGFTALPPMQEMGKLYDNDPQQALEKTEQLGWIMGSECRAAGIDCSFAPVLDINTGASAVIGNRSFHHDPKVISQLGCALVRGMHRAGLMAVAKHFPGHGHVQADSHIAIPIDERSFTAIAENDLLPFKYLIEAGIDGVMPAHVIYPVCDEKPSGFSTFWLQQILRHELNFRGMIFSDDLCMEGASPMGTIVERAIKAKQAGCDMLLVCNNRQAAIEVIEHEHT